MAEGALPEYIQALLSPSAYPHTVSRVELIQTHISYVLLIDNFAYKIKKPVDWGFLDFSTLEKRRYYCQEEVRLNNRLCAGVYLGVTAITSKGGVIRLEGEGEPIEYAVKMRRLPQERLMETLLSERGVSSDMLARLTGKLAEFHRTSERNDYIDSFGGLDTIGGNWQENFDQTEPYIGRTLSSEQWKNVKRFVDTFLERDRGLLAQRVREGRVRDCHGDLRSDAICFTNGICIFDCIEFNERFRYSDTASDLAFLAMDLDFRGQRALSDEMVGLYLQRSQDTSLPLILHFYKCYRAYVRGKVEGFQLDQPEVSQQQKEASLAVARRYFELAEDYALRPRRRLLITMTGVTGTGKSYLAYALASRLGASVVSSDIVRKELAGLEPETPQPEAIDQGIYSEEMTARTYAEMLLRARSMLKQGLPVILDATYLTRELRQGPRRLATRMGAPILVIECVAGENLVRQRLQLRADATQSISDGRREVYEAQRERWELPSEFTGEERLTLDMALPLSEQIEIVESEALALMTRQG